ncbi:MAG: hypothetical protein ACON3Z_14755 [Bradymonadia bacterium]
MKINGLLILCILIFTWGCADEDDESLIILVPNIDLGVAPNQGDGFIAGDGDIRAADQSVPVMPPRVAQFGHAEVRQLVTTARRSDGLSHPRDLAFDPDAPANLWVVDRDWDGNVVLFDAGTAGQRIDRMRDMAATHFMEEVSSLAFSDRGSFGTCQESRNGMDGFAFPNDFMGPVLWSTDLMIHCSVNQAMVPGGLNGSHLDMLHQSPMCMGIAHQTSHAFFVADGANGHIVRYDFQEPHVPGGDDHSDGRVSRYTELSFTRVPDVPSHMEIEGDTLYYVDTGAGELKVADIATGTEGGRLIPDNEPLELFNWIEGVSQETLVSGLDTPSGLALTEAHIFISFPLTGDIVAYGRDGVEVDRIETGKPGVMGLAIGPEGRLWYVNAYEGSVNMVDPSGEMETNPMDTTRPVNGDCMYPEWGADIGLGRVMPPFEWSNASENGQSIGGFSAMDIFCQPSWDDVETIVFVVVPEWIPWLYEYTAYVDALSPQIEEAGGRVVFVGAHTLQGQPIGLNATQLMLAESTPQGSGVRVGEGNSSFGLRLMDTPLVNHLPSAFVVRRSDMRVIATQTARGAEHLPYVEIAQAPDADWSNPGPATIIPTLPSNCPEGGDEDLEPNDFPEQASRIGAGRIRGGVCERRGDFYYVDIQGPWRFELSFSHAIGDLDVILLRNGQPIADGRGQPAGAQSSTDDEVFDWQGPVMVYIYGYDGATAPYRLTISEL